MGKLDTFFDIPYNLFTDFSSVWQYPAESPASGGSQRRIPEHLKMRRSVDEKWMESDKTRQKKCC